VDAIKLLLRQKGLDLATINYNSAIALYFAVRSRRLEVVDLILRHPRANVNCIDNDSNTRLWWSTFLSYDVTERLLAAKDINANLIGGFGRLDTRSAPLHHAVTRSDTMILKQLLAAPGIDLNVCAARKHFTVPLQPLQTEQVQAPKT
jgi:ankyrin repeat protein